MGYSPGWIRVYLAMADKGFSERDSAQKAGVDLATVKRERTRNATFAAACTVIENEHSGKANTLRW